MIEDSSRITMLISQARDGSTEAQGHLLEAYRGYLQLIARVQINQQLQRRVSPSDVVQETLLQARRGFAQFRGGNEADFVAWLRRLLASQLAAAARHHLAQRRDVRLEVRYNQAVEQSSLELAKCLPAEQSSPSQQAARREQAVLLAAALDRLPNDYREVLVLRHLESYSFCDIAAQLGRTVPSVKSTWTRAVTRLRRQLKQWDQVQ